MISEGRPWTPRHHSGRYLMIDGYSEGFPAGTRSEDIPPYITVYQLTSEPRKGALAYKREYWGRWFARDEWAVVADQFEIVPGPLCACCGDDAYSLYHNGESFRCAKHRDRNPCAIEGCKRTTAVPEDGRWSSSSYFCAEHWRRFVPPRSRVRRLYQAFFRQEKQHGWGYKGKRGRSARLDWRFRRFWCALVDRARRQATEGHIDEAEINRIMGWDS